MEPLLLSMVPEQVNRHTPMVHEECSILGTMNLCYTPMGGLEEDYGTPAIAHGTWKH